MDSPPATREAAITPCGITHPMVTDFPRKRSGSMRPGACSRAAVMNSPGATQWTMWVGIGTTLGGTPTQWDRRCRMSWACTTGVGTCLSGTGTGMMCIFLLAKPIQAGRQAAPAECVGVVVGLALGIACGVDRWG